jgi:hypothetical protein
MGVQLKWFCKLKYEDIIFERSVEACSGREAAEILVAAWEYETDCYSIAHGELAVSVEVLLDASYKMLKKIEDTIASSSLDIEDLSEHASGLLLTLTSLKSAKEEMEAATQYFIVEGVPYPSYRV